MERSNYFFGLAKNWWIPLLTGLVFIGFGIWCLCDPSQSLPLMAYIFAGCIAAIGIFNILYGISNTDSNHGYGAAMAAGVIEILFGIFIFWIPGPALVWAFTYGVGIYIIFMSVYSFFDNMMAKGSSSLFWFILLFLLASLVFSLIFILGPIGGAILGWLYIGIAFICYGVYRVLLSCKLRQLNENLRNGL